MEKLKQLLEQYGRWSALKTYTDRIEVFINTDFSQSLENSKALLETIAKEICKSKGLEIDSTASINSTLKKCFMAIGYQTEYIVTQISSALATIGQQLGNLRNEIGMTSHGKTIEELRDRNNRVDELTKEFLIDSTVLIASFLIRTFENENPRIKTKTTEDILEYNENEEFNDYLDDVYGNFEIGLYSFTASEILYSIDYLAYEAEYTAFTEREEAEEYE